MGITEDKYHYCFTWKDLFVLLINFRDFKQCQSNVLIENISFILPNDLYSKFFLKTSTLKHVFKMYLNPSQIMNINKNIKAILNADILFLYGRKKRFISDWTKICIVILTIICLKEIKIYRKEF